MRTIAMSLVMLALTTTSAYGAKPKAKPEKVNADSIALVQRQQEIRDSLNAIMDKAKGGDAEAMNEVGTWYYNGKHVKQDYKQAAEWWTKSAKAKNVRAIGNLGLCYELGHGVKQDSVSATRLYKKSIAEGNQKLLKQRSDNAAKSAFDGVLVGQCYEEGVGTAKNLAQAAEYYAKAADKGSVEGMRRAGLCYEKTKDVAKGLKYYENAAAKGDAESQYRAGKILLGDMGVAPNKQQAVVYLLKAADAGVPAAQDQMGMLYTAGDGVTKNLAQAAEWYRKAATGGNAQGMWHYGNALKDGAGVDQDFDMALMWMAEAAPEGYQKKFNEMLGGLDEKDPFWCYVEGMKLYLINGHMNAATDMFKKVEKAKIDEGKVMQAVVMASKRNEKANPKKAAQMLEKLASTDAEAAFYLASLYESGNGVDQDMAQAISLYRSAADMGYGKAQSYLADIYYEGRGTDKDVLTAVALYQKALDGHQLSQNGYIRLADCYEKGEAGLTPNKEKADELRKHKPTEGINGLLKNK